MKKFISMLLVAVMALSLIACGTTEAPAAPATEATTDVAMQYITRDEAKTLLENDEYVFFDIRKAADSSANSIPGALAYDMDAAKEGDAEAGKATMTEATKDLDKKIILVCYSGKRYAQAATNALSAIGYDMSKVYTLEGGFTGWSENLPELTTAGAAPAVETVAFEGKYVVDAQYVIDNLKNENVVLVDARGEDAAKNGTVEGAIAVIWQMFADVTSGAPGDPMWGTLLPAEELSAVLSTTGISPEKEIIVFGANQFGWGDEGRIVWGLNAAGFENAKFVDGGYTALVAAGAPIVKGAAAYTAAEVKVESINENHMINTDALVADYNKFVIVDTRADEEWNGEVLYGEAAGGHLPGALHIRYTDMFNADETLKSNEELEAMFSAAGLTKDMTIVTYCTGGIRSAYMQLVLEMLGYENTLNYDESFYRWSACQDSVIPGAFEGKYVVNAEYVLANMSNENVLLVDARGEDVAKDGTVEGAIAVIWQMFADVTSGVPGDPMWGTLLPADKLSEVLSTTGISPEKEIIVFGANQFGWGDEARVVWGLNAAGFENAKFVDGGYTALVAAGAPIVKGAAAYTAADVKVETIDETHMINTDALVADYDKYTIVDTRADEEWNGEVLYGEAAGGHLPGALHIRYTDMFNADETLKGNDELKAMFTAAGLTNDQTIVTYCTGGIRSAYMQLVLEMLGYENTLNYDESFYRWSACQDCE